MRAACYLRKSTDEGDKSEDAKSITRQRDRAREYAARMGWDLPDAYVFSDDGVSGAAFNRRERPGFYRLLDALDPAPAFQVLIVSEQSRLGRDTIRALAAIQQIEDAGVEIHSYLDGRRITVAEDTDEVQSFMSAWASSQEKKKGSQRTRDALRRKAGQGYVTGGRTYGYTNVRVGDHTERQINPDEARVVESIFTLVAEGAGFRRVGRMLNVQGIKGPRGGEWSTTSVKAIVHNRLYLGEALYGRTRLVRRRGERHQIAAPPEALITQQRDEWRIITQAAWDAALRRVAKTRATWTGYRKADGQLVGRPEMGKHLLSGLLNCSCGAAMTPIVRTDRRLAHPRTRAWWGCSRWFKRSQLGCQSRKLIGYDLLNEAVLSTFTPEHVQEVLIQETFNEPIGEWALHYAEGRERAAQEVERTKSELANLTQALRLGGDVKALVQALREAEWAHGAALARLEALQDDDPEADIDLDQLAAEELELQAGLRPITLTTADPAIARATLRRLLDGPVTVAPIVDADGRVSAWELRFSGDLSRLIRPDSRLPELTNQVGERSGRVTRPRRFQVVKRLAA